MRLEQQQTQYTNDVFIPHEVQVAYSTPWKIYILPHQPLHVWMDSSASQITRTKGKPGPIKLEVFAVSKRNSQNTLSFWNKIPVTNRNSVSNLVNTRVLCYFDIWYH